MLTPFAPSTTPDLDLTQRQGVLRFLENEALNHPALRHEWLREVAEGPATDLWSVLRNYAIEYAGYSTWFPLYLRRVIDQLPSPAHKDLLRHNLEEEQGHLDPDEHTELTELGIDPASVDGVPHPELFRRFCRALGISEQELQRPTAAAVAWRTDLLRLLESASPAAAVGALGLGTENVVKPIYQQILAGIRKTSMAREDYVFFELHCTVDDQHAIDLHNVACELIGTEQDARELRRGMRAALDLRLRFWNSLSAHATPTAREATA